MRGLLGTCVAMWLAIGSAPTFAQQTYDAAQGWSKAEMDVWYRASQGSRLIRWDWLKALDTEDGKSFMTRENLERFGYIYLDEAPDALPAGFVIDPVAPAALGFNCSACHTAKVKSGGAEVLIHGGQVMADFQGFLDALFAAVDWNIASQNFDAFAERVLGENPTEESVATLQSDIDKWRSFRRQIHNTAHNSKWGRGRADAVGVILSTTSMVVTREDDRADLDLPESNAPVSYPFVWNANQQGRLQHNGVVDNGADLGIVSVAKIGALIRNWTEALGVFAEIELSEDGESVTSSVNFGNLLKIEQALAKLQSPRWPAQFGILDSIRQERGAVLFKENCNACHGVLMPDDVKTHLPLKTTLDEKTPQGFVFLQHVFDAKTKPSDFEKSIQPKQEFIGTDPTMACNAITHISPSGKLQGQRNVDGLLPTPGERVFADYAATTDLLAILIRRDVLENQRRGLLSIAENQWDAVAAMLPRFGFEDLGTGYQGQSVVDDKFAVLRATLQDCAQALITARAYAPRTPLPMYKARPLNGIWATAPYLHNGSVPTLYDLLLPQAERPSSFGYFDGELDTTKGGLLDAKGNPEAFIFNVYDKEGVVLRGNWNGGHEYGVTLSREERLDLVEYLKGL